MSEKVRLKGLLTEPQNYSKSGIESIKSFCDLTQLPLDGDRVREHIAPFDLLFVRLRTHVSADVIRAAPELKVVASPTTGLDHIDMEEARRRDVTVFHLKGQLQLLEQIRSTAEHSWALLLAVARILPAAYGAVISGSWVQDQFRGRELCGLRLGLVGCGRLGRMVAEYGLAFGMDVAAFDPYQEHLPEGIERIRSLGDLAARSDVLSVHVPLNDETTGMIDEAVFSKLPPRAIVINTSRGAIIDETALLQALRTSRLGGAGLDVLADEHVSGSTSAKLVEYAAQHDNLIITPHIGGATYEAVEKADLFITNQVEAWVRGYVGG